MQNGGMRGTSLPNGQRRSSGGIFTHSMERREFETIQLNNRRGNNSLMKVEKGLAKMCKSSGTTINYQMKQLQAAEARRQSKVLNTNMLKEKLSTKWQSMPVIEESAAWCEDPYPIVFPNIKQTDLPGGGKMFPRQRRKSIEYEDVDLRNIPTTGILFEDYSSLENLSLQDSDMANGRLDFNLLSAKEQSEQVSSPDVSPFSSPVIQRKNLHVKPDDACKEAINCLPLIRPSTDNAPKSLSSEFNKTEQYLITHSPLMARKIKSLQALH